MSNSEDEYDDISQQPQRNSSSTMDEYSASVSWPIILAIVPTLGAFFVGSADIWSDFILVLLILFYVYKWVTVPWSYYESARSRLAHFKREPKTKVEMKRRESIASELRRHELIGLIWIITSPAIAGFTLQFSRYFLSNYDRYMSSFNVVLFIVAASIKPVTHVMKLLRERTMYLQSEIQVTESQVDYLQQKLDILTDELLALRKAFATKEELGQISEGLNPTIQQLSKAVRRFERKESALRSWSEGRFLMIDEKVQKADQFVRYHVEQDQRNHSRGVVVGLAMLPLNVSMWFAQRLVQVPRHIFGGGSATTSLPQKRHLMAS